MDEPLAVTGWLVRHGYRVEQNIRENIFALSAQTPTYPLCVKISKPKYTNGVDTKAEVYMNKEIEILLKKDNNENICGVITAEILRGNLSVMIIKRMDHDLFFFLEAYNSKVSNWTIRTLIRKILNGLAWLHKHNIIHMDIKPENIMISNIENAICTQDATALELRICDFGLSIWQDEVIGFPRGSVKYIAPEGIECQFEPKSDIWAVGVINFLLLTMPMTCFPFKCASVRCDEFSYYKQQGEFKSNEAITIDDDDYSLLKDMLRIDPNLRIDAKTALDRIGFIMKI